MSEDGYTFDDSIPIRPVAPGTNLLITGASMGPAADLALSLVLDGAFREEGTLVISATDPAGRVLMNCERVAPDVDSSRIGVVDCSGQEDEGTEDVPNVETLSSPADLTGIGMQFSAFYEMLYGEYDHRVRTGIISLTTLLMYADVRPVFRFLHTLSGRIGSTGGLGVFVLDPATSDERTVNTLAQVCDGRIELREQTDAEPSALRIRGLADQPEEWTTFSLSEDPE